MGFGSLLVLLREEFVSLTGAVAVCDLTNLLVREERRVALDCGGSSLCCLVSGGLGSLLLLFSFGLSLFLNAAKYRVSKFRCSHSTLL